VRTANVPLNIDSFIIHVIDGQGNEQARFSYPSVSSGFSFDSSKKNIVLTPAEPRDTIYIRTLEKVHVKAAGIYSHFVKSTFDGERGMQTVAIDMKGEEAEHSWEL
jgi:hypothetical protein